MRRTRVVALLGMALISAPAAADQYLKSRAPKAHIDGFLHECRQKVPDASCRCMVKELASNAEGDFLLDLGAPALRLKQQPANLKSDAVLKALNRHGLKASEGKAIVDRAAPILQEAARVCA
ncbi:hypothetical protein L6Q21_06420 [Sandaracinobacter sp. RS1-74]|uniref:hypothetical protein n=1 Tax=Sandaracinobacteroides sayramensis TaxID=2913411 RepID=UPI001EDBCFA8|nr:hypothetical protein [Sandaracinobacteroides sayramensis]MCG2840613.1 hypothetical protein [Sandaracinobacteroides sayramensis]